jgi:hypothetical protein
MKADPLSSQIYDIDTDAIDALPNHVGKVRFASTVFFAFPPAEIGSLLSADSTFRSVSRSWLLPYIGRIALGLIVGALIVWGMNWVAAQDNSNSSQNENIRRIGYGLAVAVLAIQLWYGKFVATCSYVGDRGAVRYTIKPFRIGSPKIELLLFQQAVELVAKRTRQYVGVIKTGRSFNYSWNDSEHQLIYRLKGFQSSITREGDSGDFAWAVEEAWSKYFFARAQPQFQEEGSIPFRIDDRRLIRVGEGFLEFHFGDEPVKLTREEIAAVSLKDGLFSFKHKDAKWHSREGKFSFSYGAMANAKVFLLALDRLMGYRWTQTRQLGSGISPIY